MDAPLPVDPAESFTMPAASTMDENIATADVINEFFISLDNMNNPFFINRHKLKLNTTLSANSITSAKLKTNFNQKVSIKKHNGSLNNKTNPHENKSATHSHLAMNIVNHVRF